MSPFFTGPLSLGGSGTLSGDLARALRNQYEPFGILNETLFQGPNQSDAFGQQIGFTLQNNPLQGVVPTTLSQSINQLPLSTASGRTQPESITAFLQAGTPEQPGFPVPSLSVCFAPQTPVLMGDGSVKAICSVKVGELVQSYDFERHMIVQQPVKTRTIGVDDHAIHVNSGLTVTRLHRFAVGPDEWKRACELQPGDKVLSNNGSTVVIESVRWTPWTSLEVHNLSVKGHRKSATFFVSDGSAWYLVHNGDGGGAGGGGGGGGDADSTGVAGETSGTSAGTGGVGTGGAVGATGPGPAGADVGIGPGDPSLAGPAPGPPGVPGMNVGDIGGDPDTPMGVAGPDEGMGAGTARSGLSSLAAIAAARASLGGTIGGIAGSAIGTAIGMPGLGVPGAAIGGMIGGGQVGGAGIGMGMGLGNAPSAPSIGGVGTPSAPSAPK